MAIFREITDISEFDSSMILWFVFDPNTLEGFGSDAFTWESAVSEVCDALGGEINEYPMLMCVTSDGKEVFETMVEARVSYRCGVQKLSRKHSRVDRKYIHPTADELRQEAEMENQMMNGAD